MRVLGLVVDPNNGRPAVAAALLEESGGTVSVAATFEITSQKEELPSQLDTLYKTAVSRAKGLQPIDRAVIRRADPPPRVPTDADGPKVRLLAEGALIAAVHAVVPDTRFGMGRELGLWHGTNKARVDEAGAALIEASGRCGTVGLRQRTSLAAAAALAGLKLGP